LKEADVQPSRASSMTDALVAPQPLLSFLVCTYHREDLLGVCLRSLFALRGIAQATCEILVVDNSDEGSAQGAVADCLAFSPVPLRYLSAHPANISVARNLGVAEARGRFIAMIDDDMTVDPSWLEVVLPLLQAGKFHVLCGPVEPMYENPALASRESEAFFRRKLDVQEVTQLHIMGPARTRGFVPATSNAIFDRASCFFDAVPFDLYYGKSGGEDLDIFCRLHSAGRIFAWVPDARTFEHVPARRCEIDYLEKRSYVGGQVYASAYVRNARSPRYIAFKISLIARLQLALLSCKEVFVTDIRSAAYTSLRLRRSAVHGKLAWRSMLQIYAEEQRRRVSVGT
jgi:succinoglycan biosynthesis protein ExoM